MEKSIKTAEKLNNTCVWGGGRTLESKGVPKQILSVVGLVLVDLCLLGSDVGQL